MPGRRNKKRSMESGGSGGENPNKKQKRGWNWPFWKPSKNTKEEVLKTGTNHSELERNLSGRVFVSASGSGSGSAMGTMRPHTMPMPPLDGSGSNEEESAGDGPPPGGGSANQQNEEESASGEQQPKDGSEDQQNEEENDDGEQPPKDGSEDLQNEEENDDNEDKDDDDGDDEDGDGILSVYDKSETPKLEELRHSFTTKCGTKVFESKGGVHKMLPKEDYGTETLATPASSDRINLDEAFRKTQEHCISAPQIVKNGVGLSNQDGKKLMSPSSLAPINRSQRPSGVTPSASNQLAASEEGRVEFTLDLNRRKTTEPPTCNLGLQNMSAPPVRAVVKSRFSGTNPGGRTGESTDEFFILPTEFVDEHPNANVFNYYPAEEWARPVMDEYKEDMGITDEMYGKILFGMNQFSLCVARAAVPKVLKDKWGPEGFLFNMRENAHISGCATVVVRQLLTDRMSGNDDRLPLIEYAEKINKTDLARFLIHVIVHHPSAEWMNNVAEDVRNQRCNLLKVHIEKSQWYNIVVQTAKKRMRSGVFDASAINDADKLEVKLGYYYWWYWNMLMVRYAGRVDDVMKNMKEWRTEKGKMGEWKVGADRPEDKYPTNTNT